MIDIYEPTPKGLAKGLKAGMRIAFIRENYVWLVRDDAGGYSFPDGDAFEWKPGLRKPDSLWRKSESIISIGNIAGLSDYNRTVYADELLELGIDPAEK